MSGRAGQGQEGGEWQGLRTPAGPFPTCGQILHLQRHRSPREQLPGVPPKWRPEIIAGVQGGCEVSDRLRLGPPHELRKWASFHAVLQSSPCFLCLLYLEITGKGK